MKERDKGGKKEKMGDKESDKNGTKNHSKYPKQGSTLKDKMSKVQTMKKNKINQQPELTKRSSCVIKCERKSINENDKRQQKR